MSISLINFPSPIGQAVSSSFKRQADGFIPADAPIGLSRPLDSFTRRSSNFPPEKSRPRVGNLDEQKPKQAMDKPKSKSPGPVKVTIDRGFQDLSREISALQKELAEIEARKKYLIQESLRQPNPGIVRLFYEAESRLKIVQDKLEKVLKLHGSKRPPLIMILKPRVR